MSASKYPGPEGRQKLGPRAARLPAPRPHDGSVIYVQEKVLAEISHELGNFFHKLYYWSDYLKERPSRKSADATAAQMLERTIKNLEDFLKVSLDYFHPTQLSFMRMPAAEVVAALLAQIRGNLNGTPVTVDSAAEWSGEEILIDPGHLSRAFEVALRSLTKLLGAGSTLRVVVERTVRRDCTGLEVGFRLDQANEASSLFRTSEAGVEWALAEKVVALHGGELFEEAPAPNAKSLGVFLPICS